MWSCTETRCGMESGSKKSNGKYQSLAGFYFFGALLVIAVHAEIEWLALIGFLGAFGFSWWASRAWHREGDREPRRWGESVWQAAGRQGKGSSGGCTGFIGLWLTLWRVALLAGRYGLDLCTDHYRMWIYLGHRQMMVHLLLKSLSRICPSSGMSFGVYKWLEGH